MDKPHFDQQEQTVDHQQNAGGDIYNVFFMNELTGVDGSLSPENFVQVVQSVKQKLKSVATQRRPPPPKMASEIARKKSWERQSLRFRRSRFLSSRLSPRRKPILFKRNCKTWRAAWGRLDSAGNSGFSGVNLTGLWNSLTLPGEQAYIQQFGPYFTVTTILNGFPNTYAEGVINPANWFLRCVGQHISGLLVEAQIWLWPDGSLRGQAFGLNPLGFVMSQPLYWQRVPQWPR